MKTITSKPGKTSIVLILALVLGSALGLNRFRTIAELRSQNAQLDAQIVELNQLRAENKRLAGHSVKDSPDEIQRLGVEILGRESEIEQTREQIRSAMDSTSNLPPNLRYLVVPRSSWERADHSSPLDTCKSLLWNMCQGDADAILSNLTPRYQAEMTRYIEKMTRDKFVTHVAGHFNTATELRILETHTNDQIVSFCYFIGGLDFDRRKGWIQFEKRNGQWLCSGAPYEWFHN